MRRQLTDTEKATADRLGLTYTEMGVALDTHVDPETYARHKAEIRSKREEWEAKLAAVNDGTVDHLQYEPVGRGARKPE